jgi:monofunctional biosynthetic peptidoglycan transglycosylase
MLRWFRKWLLVPVMIVCAIGAWAAWECRGLPGERELRSQIFARYHPTGRSTWVPLWGISPKLQTAVVSWEDPRFYSHHGLDYDEIRRAFFIDLRSGRYSRGGSTITQQVVKNLFLSQEKTLRRKIREAVLAKRLERVLAKNEILEIYLNIADWGDGINGAEAASRNYFHKEAADVSWGEAAVLAAMLANPHLYNPLKSPISVQRRRDAVLAGLLDSHELTEQEYQHYVSRPCCAPSVQEKETSSTVAKCVSPQATLKSAFSRNRCSSCTASRGMLQELT